jgi:hypothetical protein
MFTSNPLSSPLPEDAIVLSSSGQSGPGVMRHSSQSLRAASRQTKLKYIFVFVDAGITCNKHPIDCLRSNVTCEGQTSNSSKVLNVRGANG